MKLDAKEEVEFMREINELKNEGEFTQLPNSWEDRGIRKGIEQGIEAGKQEVALKMLKEGMPIDVITKVTDLDKETIQKLKELN